MNYEEYKINYEEYSLLYQANIIFEHREKVSIFFTPFWSFLLNRGFYSFTIVEHLIKKKISDTLGHQIVDFLQYHNNFLPLVVDMVSIDGSESPEEILSKILNKNWNYTFFLYKYSIKTMRYDWGSLYC